MADRLLIDTDVLVDYLRGHRKAVKYLESLPGRLFISVVTVAELYAGVREGEERVLLEGFLRVFETVPVDHEIARKGGLYRRDFGPSHGLGLGDALIAASAEGKEARLVTLNARHFPMLEPVVPYEKT